MWLNSYTHQHVILYYQWQKSFSCLRCIATLLTFLPLFSVLWQNETKVFIHLLLIATWNAFPTASSNPICFYFHYFIFDCASQQPPTGEAATPLAGLTWLYYCDMLTSFYISALRWSVNHTALLTLIPLIPPDSGKLPNWNFGFNSGRRLYQERTYIFTNLPIRFHVTFTINPTFLNYSSILLHWNIICTLLCLYKYTCSAFSFCIALSIYFNNSSIIFVFYFVSSVLGFINTGEAHWESRIHSNRGL